MRQPRAQRPEAGKKSHDRDDGENERHGEQQTRAQPAMAQLLRDIKIAGRDPGRVAWGASTAVTASASS